MQRLAKRYITDEYVKPYMIYNDSMQSAYVDKAKISGELEKGIPGRPSESLLSAYCGCTDRKDCFCRGTDQVGASQKIFKTGYFYSGAGRKRTYFELDLHVARHVQEFRKNRRAAGKTVVPISVNLSWMDF